MGALDFTWVHPRWKEDRWLFKFVASVPAENLRLDRSFRYFRKQALGLDLFFSLLCAVIFAGYRYELHISFLFGVAEQLPVKVNILHAVARFDFLVAAREIVQAVLVAPGLHEAEVG